MRRHYEYQPFTCAARAVTVRKRKTLNAMPMLYWIAAACAAIAMSTMI